MQPTYITRIEGLTELSDQERARLHPITDEYVFRLTITTSNLSIGTIPMTRFANSSFLASPN